MAILRFSPCCNPLLKENEEEECGRGLFRLFRLHWVAQLLIRATWSQNQTHRVRDFHVTYRRPATYELSVSQRLASGGTEM